jgi:hypothetical protein
MEAQPQARPTEEIWRLVQWAADRRVEAQADLAARVEEEAAAQNEFNRADQAVKDAENQLQLAQNEVNRLGAGDSQAARDRLSALTQAAAAPRATQTQARMNLNEAVARRKAAEAVLRARTDAYHELLNTAKPRFSVTLARWLSWAFSGERGPQFLTSFVVLLSMWFIWLTSRNQIAEVAYARGMITLLFGVGTIVIALILTLTAILQAGLTAEDRFKFGMQILTVLIGVFGTILGFYFGSMNPSAAGPGTSTATVTATETPAEPGKETVTAKAAAGPTRKPGTTPAPGSPTAKQDQTPAAPTKGTGDAVPKPDAETRKSPTEKPAAR